MVERSAETGSRAENQAPPKGGSVRYGNSFFDRANRRHQAGMLLRAFSVGAASGVEPLGVFTFYFGEKASSTRFPEYTLSTWTDFDCTGVHNEVIVSGQSTTQRGSLWRRPAWYTLRRLVWLRHRTRAWTLRSNNRGLTVVELTFAGHLREGPDGTPLRRAWSRAYLCWNDQYADDPSLHDPADIGRAEQVLLFLDRDQHGYELVSAAPDLGMGPLDAPTVAATGYAELALDWTWRYGGATWSSAAPDLSRHSDGGTPTWSFRLLKSDPDTAPLPILLFTDADYVPTTAQRPSVHRAWGIG